jgi:hypothetical protein
LAQIVYNGVSLEITKVNSLAQRAVRTPDDADYLYTECTLDVIAVVNPKATSPIFPDIPAPASIPLLRQALLVERKRLTYTVGGVVVLGSPFTNFVGLDANGIPSYADVSNRDWVDAWNGPKPLRCDVLQWHGERTCIIRWVCQTWINECTGSSSQPISPVIGHRWTASDDVNDLYHTTRMIDGWMKCRTDVLLNPLDPANPMVVDEFRKAIFHPIADGMKREKIFVQPSSDGTELKYRLVDVEQPLSWQGGIIKAEGFYVNHLVWGGGGGLGSPFVNAATMRRKDSASATIAAQVLQWAVSMLPIPVFHYNVSLRLWGRKDVTRQTLVNKAMETLSKYVFQGASNAGVPLEGQLQVDLVNKFVQAEVNYFSAGQTLASFGGLFGDPFGQIGKMRRGGDFPEDMDGIGQFAPARITTPEQSGDEHRGDMPLYQLAAQILKSHCGLPAVPKTGQSGQRKIR